MGDTVSIVLSDITLEDAASELGLEIKRSKVVGHTAESRMLFEEQFSLPDTSSATVILLATPLSAGHHGRGKLRVGLKMDNSTVRIAVVRQSQSMNTAVCFVVLALMVIHATTR